MADAFDNIAKEAEKLTPWALMTAGTKVTLLHNFVMVHVPCICPLLLYDSQACAEGVTLLVQAQAKGILKRNWTKIAAAFIQGSIYCALYHHATEELKKRTQKKR